MEEIVAALRSEGYGTDEAVGAVIALKLSRQVDVVEPRPYSSLPSFALSPLSLWFWAALAAIILSAALTTVTSGVALYLRYVFGGALVLFLPGYGLIEALYPKKGLDSQVERVALIRADMNDGLTRFALSIGLSLAITPLVGLVLNYTPFGIRLIPVTISLAGLTVALLLTALYRKHQYYRLAKDIV